MPRQLLTVTIEQAATIRGVSFISLSSGLLRILILTFAQRSSVSTSPPSFLASATKEEE
jgi:hypothetical protein